MLEVGTRYLCCGLYQVVLKASGLQHMFVLSVSSSWQGLYLALRFKGLRVWCVGLNSNAVLIGIGFL